MFVPSQIPEGIRGIFIFLCCFPSWLKIFLSCWKRSNVTRPDDQIRMSVAALNLSVEILLSILIRKPEARICFSLEMTNLHICIFLHSKSTLKTNYLSDLCLIFSYFLFWFSCSALNYLITSSDVNTFFVPILRPTDCTKFFMTGNISSDCKGNWYEKPKLVF